MQIQSEDLLTIWNHIVTGSFLSGTNLSIRGYVRDLYYCKQLLIIAGSFSREITKTHLKLTILFITHLIDLINSYLKNILSFVKSSSPS